MTHLGGGENIINVHETATTHFENDYEARTSREITTQKYPLFPLLREQGIHRRDCKGQEEIHEKDSCQKYFPKHSKLTPGLYIFNDVKGRKSCSSISSWIYLSEKRYNPHKISDASCLTKEFGYNRELRRFMMLRITTDLFHQCNHTTCSDSFKSSQYQDLNGANSEACEQVNSALKRITNSTPFMSPILFFFYLLQPPRGCKGMYLFGPNAILEPIQVWAVVR